jgi:hypothetical protein
VQTEPSLTLERYDEEKLMEYLERCEGKFNFKVWGSAFPVTGVQRAT